jgi:hypothetical protein
MFVTRFCPFLSEEKYISASVAQAARAKSDMTRIVTWLKTPSRFFNVVPPSSGFRFPVFPLWVIARKPEVASFRFKGHVGPLSS